MLKGLQYKDNKELERLYNKYSDDKELRRLLELVYMEKQYAEQSVDGILLLIRALAVTNERDLYKQKKGGM